MTEEISNSLNLPETGLILIGMGPGKFSSMTIESIQAAKQCDSLRYEAYTALWPQEELDLLGDECGEITKVMRPEIESPELLFKLAEDSLVGLLVVGDPLQATTHVDLQLQAAEAGIECITFHGISITTIVTGALGLSNYKFGRQTTLTYPYGGWVATSPLEVLAQNFHLNLHTLALLDLDPTGAGTGDQRPMKPEDAVTSLAMMFAKLQDSIEDMQGQSALENMRIEACKQYLQIPIEQRIVVLCSDMGCANEQIITTTVGQLSQHQGGRLNCLVFPSNMSDVEEEALLRWK